MGAIIENRAIENGMIESKVIESRTLENRVIESRALENRVVKSRALENRVIESRALENRMIANRTIKDRAVKDSTVRSGVIGNRMFTYGTVMGRVAAVRSSQSRSAVKEGTAAKRKAYGNIRSAGVHDYELTPAGWIACAAAGLLEELTVLLALGIELMQTPVPVFLVLWAAFGIMTSGLLAGAAAFRDIRAAAAYGVRSEAVYAEFPTASAAYTAGNDCAAAAWKKAS